MKTHNRQLLRDITTLFIGTFVAFAAQAAPITGDDWFQPRSLFISHLFNPDAMRRAEAVDVAYQNVLDPWIDATANGTFRRVRLDVDLTLLPGVLYEILTTQDGYEHELIVVSPPGFYPAGTIIRTDAEDVEPLVNAPVVIEDAQLDVVGLTTWLTRQRDLHVGDETPLVVLDWERSWQNRLLNPSHPGHSAAIAQGILALEIAHLVWPEAAITFYGSPWSSVEPTPEWEDEMAMALWPLVQKMDWLAPSLYDKILDEASTQSAIDRQLRRHESSMRLACRLADGRPILPWVRHRFHQPATSFHNKLIAKPEFLDHLHWAWRFTAYGEFVDGFVLWYRDRDNWENTGIAPPEFNGSITVAELLDETEKRYHGWIQSVLDE
jgi:hypothetical protein